MWQKLLMAGLMIFICQVMLCNSADRTNFSEPMRVNDITGDATVRNENPPKVSIGAQGEVYVGWASDTKVVA